MARRHERGGEKDEVIMITWLTTSPNPRSPATGYDAGQRGWRLHAIPVDSEEQNFKEIRFNQALCGLSAAHGWNLDMFIDTPCARCLKIVEKQNDEQALDSLNKLLRSRA